MTKEKFDHLNFQPQKKTIEKFVLARNLNRGTGVCVFNWKTCIFVSLI